MATHDSHAYQVLGLCQQLAPTSAEQQGFSKIVWDMEAAGESDFNIASALLGALIDGFQKGNWPQPQS